MTVSVVAIGKDCDVTGRDGQTVKRGSKERSEEKGMETSQLFEQNRNKKTRENAKRRNSVQL